jgi:hypothetical protein
MVDNHSAQSDGTGKSQPYAAHQTKSFLMSHMHMVHSSFMYTPVR